MTKIVSGVRQRLLELKLRWAWWSGWRWAGWTLEVHWRRASRGRVEIFPPLKHGCVFISIGIETVLMLSGVRC